MATAGNKMGSTVRSDENSRLISSVPETGGRQLNEGGADESIGPLLARANLLRMRGQWEEAVAACTEALRKSPKSPTAHSLMGEIYETQGKVVDAMQWYGMALDLAPDNRIDRSKLDRLTELQRRRLQSEANARPSAPAENVGATERTLRWFDRLFPPGKAESIARLILMISIAIALLFICAAYFSGPSEPLTRIVLTAPPEPIVVPPLPNDTPTAPVSLPSPAPAPSFQMASGSRVLAPDTTMRDAIAQHVSFEVTILDVQIDPRSEQATIGVALSARAAESPSATRERIVRAALQTARAAVLTIQRIAKLSIHVSLSRGATMAEQTTPLLELAFIGDLSADSARNAGPVAVGPTPRPALFTSAWWNLALHPDNAPQ